jgi:hypothetical protein
MKKIMLVLILFCAMASHATAQEQGDIRVHALGFYGLRFNEFGVGGGVEYFFADRFALMPSFLSLMPEVGNASNFSFDLRYYLTEGASQVYLMAGYSQSFQNTQPGDPGLRRNFVGANFGIGAYIPLTEWVGLSTEFKVQSQTPQEAGFKIGFAFPL